MAKVTFDGVNKQILINAGVTSIDVEKDLYSEWKRWMMLSDNAKYLPAFRTFGGDDTSTTQTAPKYFFLTNDWVVVADNVTVEVQSNLYTDGTGSPFIVQNNGSVSARNSDAQLIKSQIDHVIDYGGYIYLDVDHGVSGTDYPVGTLAQPVNNCEDGLIIAQKYNINSARLLSDLVLSIPMNKMTIKGSGSEVLNLNNQTLDMARFEDLLITGTMQGSFAMFMHCQIVDLHNFNGLIEDCYLSAVQPIDLQNGARSTMNNCRSAIAGSGSPKIDWGNGDIELSIRAYSGGMQFLNSTDPLNACTIEYIAGRITMDNTNTAGQFHIRGIVDTEMLAPDAGVTLVTEGMIQHKINIDPQEVRDAMALDLSNGTTVGTDSVEDKLNRIDTKTQEL